MPVEAATTEAAPIAGAMSAAFRRRVRILGRDSHCSADVEDDQHRFGADITHDGAQVLTLVGRSLRTPWTTCPQAIPEIQALAGKPLLRSPFAVLRQVSLGMHCTHLIDMAALAVSAAARSIGQRQYDAVFQIGYEDGADWRLGTLQRDGDMLARWVLKDGIVIEPIVYGGREIRRTASWITAQTNDEDEIEAAFVMQRAVLVAGGKRFDLDKFPRTNIQRELTGACFAYQPSRIDEGRRNIGSTRQFSSSDELLADLPALGDS